MLCPPRESIQPGSLWKALGSVACVRCWRPTVVTSRQVIVCLFRSLCPYRESITTVHRWYWTPTSVCARGQPWGGICPPPKVSKQQFWHLQKYSMNKDEIWCCDHLEKSYLNFFAPMVNYLLKKFIMSQAIWSKISRV